MHSRAACSSEGGAFWAITDNHQLARGIFSGRGALHRQQIHALLGNQAAEWSNRCALRSGGFSDAFRAASVRDIASVSGEFRARICVPA